MKTLFHITDKKETKVRELTSLAELKRGESAFIHQIEANCDGFIRRRLLDLGFVPGTKVTHLGQGLFNGPARFQIRGNVIALREDQSAQITASNI